MGSHVHVRLSGQDCVRGTFNQRHAAVYCSRTSYEHIPLDNMRIGPQDKFCAANSPLSEHAVLGFEYGFASEIGKEALVLWEAQFGDLQITPKSSSINSLLWRRAMGPEE